MTTTFLEYLILRVHEASPVGDLARDVADCAEMAEYAESRGVPPDAPPLSEPAFVQDLVDYVSTWISAGDAANAAARAWLDYLRYVERERAESGIAA